MGGALSLKLIWFDSADTRSFKLVQGRRATPKVAFELIICFPLKELEVLKHH